MSQLLFPFTPATRKPAHAEPAKAPLPQTRALVQRQPESALVSAQASTPPAVRIPRADLFLSPAQQLAEQLEECINEAVEVEFTDNAWTMVSYKRIAGRLHYRLHHMFAAAPADVVRAIAGFCGRARKLHGKTIDAFIRTHRQLIRTAPAPDANALQTRGDVHDLAEIYTHLNGLHFEGKIDARIGWGRRAPDRRRRSIKMGVYMHDQRLIRIHPALDDVRVPRMFVELVTFHEMLHQAIPPKSAEDGRRCVHGREFREAERKFPAYEQARAWEKSHLHILLRRSS